MWEGMQRLGIDPQSVIGVRVAECGFEPYERDDGLHGMGPGGARYSPQRPRYNAYLNDKNATAGENPWHDWANAAAGEGQFAGLGLGDAPRAQTGAGSRGRFLRRRT